MNGIDVEIVLSKMCDKILSITRNITDRITVGAVIDFIDFHVFDFHWPAFNVADSAICFGAAMIILESFFTQNNSPS